MREPAPGSTSRVMCYVVGITVSAHHFRPLAIVLACSVLWSCSALDPNTDSERQGEGGCPPPDGTNWPSAAQSFECEVLALVNEQRAKGAVCGGTSMGATSPLVMHAELRSAARSHARNMADQGFFDHRDPEGREPADRVSAAGYEWSAVGENIAAGSPTAAETMDQWMNSPGHCANIMDPTYEHLGVGYADAPSSEYGHFWVQNFGRPM